MSKTSLISRANILLSNYQIYYQNLRGFHWNIQGSHFFELHAKFEEMYNDATLKIDEIAQRILALEGTSLHTYADYINTTSIQPKKEVRDGKACVSAIVEDLSIILSLQRGILQIASEISDSGTEDLMSTYIEQQEKTLWMMRAWLK